MNEMIFRIRPFELNKGETDRVFRESVDALCHTLRTRKPFEDHEDLPSWLSRRIARHKGAGWEKSLNSLGKVYEQLYGKAYKDVLHDCHERLSAIEVDRLRVKPVVKIIGEFWAQITEGDGNFNMFAFLEREGAHVLVEPIGTWIMYMMYQAKERARENCAVNARYRNPAKWELHKHALNQLQFLPKWLMWTVGERVYGSVESPTIWFRKRKWRGWRILSTTSLRAAVKDTSRSARTSITPSTASATWCWRLSPSGVCLPRSRTARSPRSPITSRR
jgi:hypothetical protein